MGVAKTVISVAIIGNAKQLVGTLNTADAKMGGFLKGAAKGFIAFKVVDTVFDGVKSVLDNADRAGDALSRIKTIVGQVDADKLDAISGDFADLSVSAPDFLEIVAGFSEFATASGKIDAQSITDMAGGVAQFAGALGRLKDVDPATLGDDIANFISGARGAQPAAKELGLPFDAALTPAQRYAQLMERLPGLLDSVTGANAGLDDKQGELQARWETLGKEVGPGFEDVLSGILGFILDEIDALPAAIEGFGLLGDAITHMAEDVLTPLARARDAIQGILDLASQAFGGPGGGGGVDAFASRASSGRSDSGVKQANDRNADRGGTVRDRVGGP